MSLKVRHSGERGYFDYGWLKTHHTFSFGPYIDPLHMGFRNLRVINEDYVSPDHGFDTHPHKDMEIVTLVLDGQLTHRDSTGGASVIHSNEIQVMTAGTGLSHSERNDSHTTPVHLFQMWIIPDQKSLPPSYRQRRLPSESTMWTLLVSKEGREGSLKIHQDVDIFLLQLSQEQQLTHTLKKGRYGWLQIASGSLNVNGVNLVKGDGLAIDAGAELEFIPETDVKALFFDLN